MDIPLKLKYRRAVKGRYSNGATGDSHKKRPGYAKHKYGTGTNHTPMVMVVLPNGKRRMMRAEQ
jgi:hypothetical protein